MQENQPVRFNPYNPYEDTDVSKRNLPHWEQPCGCYFITFRLGDSLPQHFVDELKDEKQQWLEKHPTPWSDSERSEYGKLFTKREENWLDAGYGACHLKSPIIRQAVVESLEKFDTKRYELDCYTLMPNHAHLIWQMLAEYSNKKELKSLKGASARNCNRHLNRTGTFWMEESYDRLIRNKEELTAFRKYIESNPTKAGLAEGEYTLQMNNRLTTH